MIGREKSLGRYTRRLGRHVSLGLFRKFAIRGVTLSQSIRTYFCSIACPDGESGISRTGDEPN